MAHVIKQLYGRKVRLYRGYRHSSVDSPVPTILPPRVLVPSTPTMLLSFVLYMSCGKNENKQFYESKTLAVYLSLCIKYSGVLLLIFRFTTSVTRLGDLLDFGLVFKGLATINLLKSSTFFDNFVKLSKSIIFVVKSFLRELL